MWITFPIGLPSLSSIVGPLTLKGTTGKIKCAKDPVRYQLVNDVPRGRVCELPALAAALNIPPRHAAYILATLTGEEATLIVWHRIVPSGGRFTTAKRKKSRGADQISRLEAEGVYLGPDGAIRGWPALAWQLPDTHAGTIWADEEDAD